jgi:predicted LPLAT superfamily acyltransferase
MSVERSEHWADIPERGELVGVKVMYAAYALLGRWAFTLLLYPVVAYFWATDGRARRASRDYLARVRERLRELDRPFPRLSRFGHLLEFGNAVLDKCAAWAGRIRASHVELDDPNLFARLRASGGGVLFIGSHLGNLDVLRAYTEIEQAIAINALVFTRNSPRLNGLMSAVGPRALDRLIDIDTLGPESVVQLQNRIRAGEHLAVAADRVSARHRERSIHAPFLGAPAPFPEGPFILASLLACPVYLVFCLRIDGRYRVLIEPFTDRLVLPRERRDEALEQAVARYAKRLEERCLLAPMQWFNFFDFWEQADPERPRGEADGAN